MRKIERSFLFTNVFISLLLIFFIVLRLSLIKKIPDKSTIRYSGEITSEPQIKDDRRLLKLRNDIVTWVPLYPEISYGDYIVIKGFYEDGILKEPVIEEHQYSNSAFFRLREKVIGFFNSALPTDSASLIAGVTLGSKEYLSPDLKNKLKRTGTTHIVVASGMNVILVGGTIFSASLKFINRRRSAILSIIVCWTYAMFAGLEAPLVRASIMVSLSTIALISGRIYSSIRALILAGFIMLLIKPMWLFDIGFQLSFLSTISLILFGSKLTNLFSKIPVVLREGFSTSIAAQIGVAPLIYVYFGSINIFSPFINAIILWTIPTITIGGMLAGVLSIIHPLLGKLILFAIYPLIWWFQSIITLFGE